MDLRKKKQLNATVVFIPPGRNYTVKMTKTNKKECIDYDERCSRGFVVKATRDSDSISAVITYLNCRWLQQQRPLLFSCSRKKTATLLVCIRPVARLLEEGGGWQLINLGDGSRSLCETPPMHVAQNLNDLPSVDGFLFT